MQLKEIYSLLLNFVFFSQLKLTSFEVLDYKRKQNCIKFYKNIRINVSGI